MRFRTTFVLLTLFAAALGALWWVEHARVPTREKRQAMVGRLLPELVDTPVSEVVRLEVSSRETGQRLAVERRPGGLWQVVEPLDAAADPAAIETLVRNLKDLRTSPDAGTIDGDPALYGLDRPRATVSIFDADRHRPLAAIELGGTVRDDLYVRPVGSKGIEVVDARLLTLALEPVGAWRDRSLFRVPSFRVETIAIHESGPDRDVELRRDERKWLMTRPLRAPADDDRAEGLVAELGALRVVDDGGFVAEDVDDLAPYGLDHPWMTITVTPYAGHGQPRTLVIGTPAPGQPDVRHAKRADQDDVVKIDVKRLREAYPGPVAMRSKKVVDLQPRLIERVRVEARGQVFDLSLSRGEWTLTSPWRGPADRASVQELVTALGALTASEFLEPTGASDPRLEPTSHRIQVWQMGPPASNTPPRVDLRLGRHDLVRKTVYGQLAGDRLVLAVPDAFLEAMPRNELAFRDLNVETFDPADVDQLSIERDGVKATLRAPGSGTSSTHWRMIEPVEAPADESSVTQALIALGGLRAATWENAQVGDGRAFGLDAPRLRVSWTLRPGPDHAARPTRTLRIGAEKPGTGLFHAAIEGQPGVFTVHLASVLPLQAEMRDRSVLHFSIDEVDRVELAWPSRTLAVRPRAGPAGKTIGWEPLPGYDPTGFDLDRLGGLVAQLADLKTPRFLQYGGPVPEAFGLAKPRVTVRFRMKAPATDRVLRVGSGPDAGAAATNVDGPDGPVFLIATPKPWDLLLVPPRRLDDLPADPFAPPTPRP